VGSSAALKDDSPERGPAYGWAALLLYASSCLLPLFEARPNRIAGGRMVPLWELWPLAALVCLSMAAVGIGLAAGTWPGRPVQAWRSRASFFVRGSGAVTAFALFAGPALLLSAQAAGAALPRVSPGSGFWSLLAAAFLAFRWARPRRAQRAALRVFWPLALGLGIAALACAGLLDRFSPYMELRVQGRRFWAELARHVGLSLSAFSLALVAGTAGAVALSRSTLLGRVLSGAAATIQNIPSLALFGLLLPVMAAIADALPWLRSVGISGIGAAPAFLALSAYAILPIMLSGAAGLRMVDGGAKDAARGMGMSRLQVLARVELPLALPSLAAGARTALVQTIGTTTIAALIGAGGMGYFVFQGVGQAAMDMVIIGVIPIALLSFAADKGMALLERALSRKADRPWP
jgi:osmoprotectant transport system permease protein